MLSIVLGVVVVAAAIAFVWVIMRLDGAFEQIERQQNRITEQDRQLEEQRDLIERKEEFGAAVSSLLDAVDPLVGLPYETLVPWDRVETIVDDAWEHRWDAVGLRRDANEIAALTVSLTYETEAARSRAATNTSSSPWEAALDRLGAGWVSTTFADITGDCGADALACVASTGPFEVRVASSSRSDPKMTDWIRTGVAYHEYAHVLQFTNPGATDLALAAFGGDAETMADCYALTFLDGWSLEHEVPVDDLSYWEVDVGYGYSCDEAQKQVIRDWVSGLGVAKRSLGG